MHRNGQNKPHLFPLGRVMITPGALKALLDTDEGMGTGLHLLKRHVTGDWGSIHAGDKGVNEQALKDGARIMSVYQLHTGVIVWVITEADRAATTFLLPEEY